MDRISGIAWNWHNEVTALQSPRDIRGENRALHVVLYTDGGEKGDSWANFSDGAGVRTSAKGSTRSLMTLEQNPLARLIRRLPRRY